MIRTLRREVTTAPIFVGWVFILAIMILIGVIVAINVFAQGLQITNLSDQVPWGLWITIDLSAIALGAGAFSISALVYLLGIKALRPIARLAVFTGLIGYTGAMLALLMDIGRPERFWHPLIYWNVHSVLWEITMCVMLYATVLITEFAPVFLETPLMKRIFPAGERLGHQLHRLTPFAAILGLALSLLHQSSLGATYGVLVARPIWFRPSLPVMFILSAVGAGATVILGVTVLYENLKRLRQIPQETRRFLALFGGLMTLGYLYLNLWDYLATNYYSHLPARVEQLALLNRFAPYGTSFWLIEVFLGAFVPAVLLLWPRTRKNDGFLMLAAVLAIIGIVVNRWNVTLSGLIVPMDWSPGVAEVFSVNAYRPSWVEWGIASLVIGYVLMAFTLGLRYLSFFGNGNYSDVDEEHE